jgi:drug/metabolite transporter (DMT)-like permease
MTTPDRSRPNMSLAARLEFAITELRVQMLSTEVLFGFQLQGTFREQFALLSDAARSLDVVALTSLVVTLAALIAGPAQHRIVERGNATRRLLNTVGWLSGIALLSWAITFGCDAFIVSERFLGRPTAIGAGVCAFAAAMGMWFWLPKLCGRPEFGKEKLPEFEEPSLREKITQMLREAWVALPGATGLFGFQLAVTMLDDFSLLPTAVQRIHFIAAATVAASIIILVTPGQLHRVAYKSRDDQRAHDAGARLLSVALAPLAIGVSADYYVAVGKVIGYNAPAKAAAIAILILLLVVWYAIPWAIRTVTARPR